MEYDVLENGLYKISFTKSDGVYSLTDAIVLSAEDYAVLTQDQFAAMVQDQFTRWKELLIEAANRPPVDEVV